MMATVDKSYFCFKSITAVASILGCVLETFLEGVMTRRQTPYYP
jgi:hypothetical protein